ncbi:MAG: 2-C-methyl-D-erythritol 2,4-cyclodiphosphate synthase [Chloroflexota bacterium]|nr:2-C-methyl-D-erythritol 2,4-cyclodiphosphate synthase [Chloroflexota bacterium]
MSEPSPFADAIVVAAGLSSRMGGDDKLALDLAGRPVLAWSLAAVAAAPEVRRIVVVTTPSRRKSLESTPWLPDKVVAVVTGGERRQESVQAGFAALAALAAGDGPPQPDRVVLVHDGARPLASIALVSAVARATAAHGAAIPVLPVSETIKRLAGDLVGETVDRSGLATAQTPQGVRIGLLAMAYEQFPAAGPETWTDEAALLEACRIPVHAIPGEPDNLKVTVPADLARAQGVLLGGSAARIGFGQDRHPFGPGEPLALGGLEFAGAPRLHGHSDGDVALHAVADALLGAAGQGDLGRLFPADARTPRGIPSEEILGEVVRRLAAHGLRPARVDLTIVASRPRLAARLDEMRDRVATLLGVRSEAVSVKASTGNLDGLEGAGRGISAQAIAVVEAIR